LFLGARALLVVVVAVLVAGCPDRTTPTGIVELMGHAVVSGDHSAYVSTLAPESRGALGSLAFFQKLRKRLPATEPRVSPARLISKNKRPDVFGTWWEYVYEVTIRAEGVPLAQVGVQCLFWQEDPVCATPPGTTAMAGCEPLPATNECQVGSILILSNPSPN
jgi:hypothetical protein